MEPHTLFSTFLAHLGEAGSRAVHTDERLVQAVVELVDGGVRAWPALALSPDHFVAHLAGVLPTDEPDLARLLGSVRAADLFLACACARGVPGAEKLFRAEMRETIGSCAIEVDGATSFADQVEALTVSALLVAPGGERAPRIARYGGRIPLTDWVAVAAARVTLSLVRDGAGPSRQPEAAVSAKRLVDEDSELAYLRRYYKNEFESAFAHAFAALTDREQALLRLHLGAGVSLDVVARIYGVSPPTVRGWIDDARAGLAEESQTHLKRQLHVSPAEFDSVARVLPTQIEARMTQLLYGPPRRASGF